MIKKIIICLLILNTPVLSVFNKWVSTGDTLYNNAGNWSLGHVPDSTDTIAFDNGSVVNCYVNEDIQCNFFASYNTYTGNFNDGGHSVTVANGSIYVDKVVSNGGYFTASGLWTLKGQRSYCTIYERGANRISIGNMKIHLAENRDTLKCGLYALKLTQLICGTDVNDTIWINGLAGASSTIQLAYSGDSCIVFNGGAIRGNISQLQIRPYATGRAWSGSFSSLIMTTQFIVAVPAYTYEIRIPKFKGTVVYFCPQIIATLGNNLITFEDSCIVKGQLVFSLYGGLNNTLDLGNNVFQADTINASIANGCKINCSSANVTFTKRLSLTQADSSKINLQESKWYGKGNVVCSSAIYKINTRGSVFTLDSTCSITSGGTIFDSIYLAPSGTYAATDTLKCRFVNNHAGRTGVWLSCGVSSVMPSWSYYGDTISVNGRWAGQEAQVRIGDSLCTITSRNDSVLRVRIPFYSNHTRRNVIVNSNTMSDTLFYSLCFPESKNAMQLDSVGNNISYFARGDSLKIFGSNINFYDSLFLDRTPLDNAFARSNNFTTAFISPSMPYGLHSLIIKRQSVSDTLFKILRMKYPTQRLVISLYNY